MTDLSPETRLKRNPQVVARELAPPEGAVLLHLQTGAYHGLNQIGLIVWNHVDGERDVAALTEAVRANVEDAPPEVERDVVRFLEGALERELILRAD